MSGAPRTLPPPPTPHSHLMIGVLFRDQEGQSCAPEEAGKKVQFYKKKRAVRVRFPILTQGKEDSEIPTQRVRMGSRACSLSSCLLPVLATGQLGLHNSH